MSGDARAARHLAKQAGMVSQVSGRGSWRAVLRRIADAVLDRPPRSQAASGWWDTASQERPGWRERAAHLDADIVFSIDYRSCRRCGLGLGRAALHRPALPALRTGQSGARGPARRTSRPELAHPRRPPHRVSGVLDGRRHRSAWRLSAAPPLLPRPAGLTTPYRSSRPVLHRPGRPVGDLDGDDHREGPQIAGVNRTAGVDVQAKTELFTTGGGLNSSSWSMP